MRRVMPALLAVVALLTAACGGDAESTTTTVAVTTTITTPATSTTADPGTTTVPATTSTTNPEPTTTTLAGAPIDFGPREGDELMVIGVRHDDVLNLRAAPGADQPIADEIPPTFTGLIARGNTRNLDPSFWIEVDFDGSVGWVNLVYVGYEGEVTDDTSSVIDRLRERPVEPTMVELAELVATLYASEEPESDIVQVTPVSTGDLAEVTYDVIGLGDDAVRGTRIHVFAEMVDGGFGLRSAEVMAICGRGVDEDRLCT